MPKKFKHGMERDAFEYKGELYTMSELLRFARIDVSLSTLSYRIKAVGWPVHKALTTPPTVGNPNSDKRPRYQFRGRSYPASKLYAYHPRPAVSFSAFLKRLKLSGDVEATMHYTFPDMPHGEESA